MSWVLALVLVALLVPSGLVREGSHGGAEKNAVPAPASEEEVF